jgi:hypothetical protein
MRVLIQDGRNKKYFAAGGQWVKEVERGEDFESHSKAVASARKSKVAEFNIMLYSGIGRYLFCVDHGKNG